MSDDELIDTFLEPAGEYINGLRAVAAAAFAEAINACLDYGITSAAIVENPYLSPSRASEPESRCSHNSLTGDEGPISDLGRWPIRWRCDECGAVVTEGADRAE